MRRERSKNTQQYSEMLKVMNEKEELRDQIDEMLNGEEKTRILSNLVDELRGKNEDLTK